ncbi:MAG TPA: tryptophan--tRNA ligase [Chloroflexi bacterium]|nr:tryptophan--tRNA ligase [Chloroflexota bacterium]
MSRPRVFSGVAPSGSLTLGNYVGAIRNWVRDQERYDNIFCVVDLHALTVPQDPQELRRQTWRVAAILLASGIDPEKSMLFVQSHVTEHTTLSWLLNTITPIGWLNRMTQFKAKAGAQRSTVGAGLLNYPVLMAADILAYSADCVPVGEDQKQHVELTRDIAERFNGLYGPTFVIPEPLIPKVGARVMRLDDPSKKMSKSEPGGAIQMLDAPDVIRKKLSRAVTDSLGVVRFVPEQSGLFNLLSIMQALSGGGTQEIENRYEGKGYKAVKEDVAELVIEALAPLQARFAEYEQYPDTVDKILVHGATSARAISGPMVKIVEEKMGLRPPLNRS